MVLFLAGCATLQLQQFNQHLDQGDEAWIAQQTVSCENESDTCSQLHLIKGEACLRLAGTGEAPAIHYACAADALAQGIALRRSWPDPGAKRRYQVNLCESLGNLHQRQSGDAAAETLARLAAAAESLYQMAPASVPATYYLAIFRHRQIESQLMDMNAANRVPICNRLKRTLTGILSVMETAQADPSPDWYRFAESYQRLAFDLGTSIQAAECR